ncbi:MAG: hypothetical protein RL235_725 [Chlamydiota bacterium]
MATIDGKVVDCAAHVYALWTSPVQTVPKPVDSKASDSEPPMPDWQLRILQMPGQQARVLQVSDRREAALCFLFHEFARRMPDTPVLPLFHQSFFGLLMMGVEKIPSAVSSVDKIAARYREVLREMRSGWVLSDSSMAKLCFFKKDRRRFDLWVRKGLGRGEGTFIQLLVDHIGLKNTVAIGALWYDYKGVHSGDLYIWVKKGSYPRLVEKLGVQLGERLDPPAPYLLRLSRTILRTSM